MTTSAKRIMLFEDNKSIHTLLRFLCQKLGFETRFEEDGTRAVEQVQEFKPDLIIMDVIMPGKGGVEACMDLRHAGVATPILMLTSKTFQEDKERGLAAGANAYLFKPFNPKELLAEIERLLPPA